MDVKSYLSYRNSDDSVATLGYSTFFPIRPTFSFVLFMLYAYLEFRKCWFKTIGTESELLSYFHSMFS